MIDVDNEELGGTANRGKTITPTIDVPLRDIAGFELREGDFCIPVWTVVTGAKGRLSFVDTGRFAKVQIGIGASLDLK
jgi:hypothetical protein